MNNRELDLLKLGFKKNEHQNSYSLSKYGEEWYIDFWNITDYTDQKWNILIEDIKHDLSEFKKQFFEGVRDSFGYKFAVKENKKQIRDNYNKYNSWLQEEQILKPGKRLNLERIKELEIKVQTLQELL